MVNHVQCDQVKTGACACFFLPLLLPAAGSLIGAETVAGLGQGARGRTSVPLADRPERQWQVRTVAVGAAPFGEIPSNQEILRRISALIPQAGQNEADQHVVSQVILKQFTEPW
jgi:hypothetical protein